VHDCDTKQGVLLSVFDLIRVCVSTEKRRLRNDFGAEDLTKSIETTVSP
jgi:hypothetical protein